MRRFPFVDVPIVQAPMAGATTPELVAAVSNAGGLGSLPGGYAPGDAIAEQIARVRALTDRPFAVNLFVGSAPPVSEDALRRAHERLRTYRDELGIAHPASPPVSAVTFEEQFAVVLAARPAVFSFTFGIPDADVLARCDEAGIFTIGTAKTVEEARALERAGVGAVCAQGYEAGGHHGPFIAPTIDANIGTLALVPQVVDAVRVPVLAAGGIGDGRGLAAVLALGASAAQIGSAFLLCDESGVSATARRALGGEANRETTLTTVFSGRTARGIRNRFIDEMSGSADIAPYPYQHTLTRDIRDAATAQGRADLLSVWCGQAVALATSQPAAAIIAQLMEDARAAALRASGALSRGGGA